MEDYARITAEERSAFFLDTVNRKMLIGHAAVDSFINSGGHPADLCEIPNFNLLLQGNVEAPSIESAVRTQLNKTEATEDGRFILELLNDTDQTLTARLYDRAWQLGLTRYSLWQIRKPGGFGSMIAYLEQVGEKTLHRKSHYDDLELEDLVQIIIDAGKEEQKKPTLSTLDERAERLGIPNVRIIRRLLKRINPELTFYDLYEMAGYSESTHSWTNDRYEQWGVNYVWANGGRVPSAQAMDDMSKQHKGPSSNGAIQRFGSVGNYQSTLDIRLQKIFNDFMDMIELGLLDRSLPPEIIQGTKSEWTVIRRYMKYSLIDETSPPEMTMSEKFAASRLLGTGGERLIKDNFPGVDLDAIKSSARAKNYYAAIWPRKSGLYRKEKRKSTARVLSPSTGRLEELRLGIGQMQFDYISKNFYDDDPAVIEYLKRRGQEIRLAIEQGRINTRLFGSARSGRDMVKIYETFELLSLLAPRVGLEEKTRLCIMHAIDISSTFKEIVKKANPDTDFEHAKNLQIFYGYAAIGSRRNYEADTTNLQG